MLRMGLTGLLYKKILPNDKGWNNRKALSLPNHWIEPEINVLDCYNLRQYCQASVSKKDIFRATRLQGLSSCPSKKR